VDRDFSLSRFSLLTAGSRVRLVLPIPDVLSPVTSKLFANVGADAGPVQDVLAKVFVVANMIDSELPLGNPSRRALSV
jgi:hypothetical protein